MLVKKKDIQQFKRKKIPIFVQSDIGEMVMILINAHISKHIYLND